MLDVNSVIFSIYVLRVNLACKIFYHEWSDPYDETRLLTRLFLLLFKYLVKFSYPFKNDMKLPPKKQQPEEDPRPE